MKIAHLPTDVGGFSAGLAEGQKLLGDNAKVFSVNPGPFGYRADEKIENRNQNIVFRTLQYFLTFLRIRGEFDVYVFNYGSSLIHNPDLHLNLIDLPYYAKKAKKVMVFQGCDARQKYQTMSRVKNTEQFCACTNPTCYEGMCNSGERDEIRRKVIAKVSKYCDAIFALNPDLMHFLPSEKSHFLPYAIDGYYDIQESVKAIDSQSVLHIVHAPSNRAVKGTEVVLKAIKELSVIYPLKVKFTLLENMERHKALKVVAGADLFIDQLNIGWYGAAAVEAMKSGVPVLAYINQNDLKFVPTEMAQQLPIINVNSFTLKDKLIEIMQHPESLISAARSSIEYVQRWHDSKNVAKLFSSYL